MTLTKDSKLEDFEKATIEELDQYVKDQLYNKYSWQLEKSVYAVISTNLILNLCLLYYDMLFIPQIIFYLLYLSYVLLGRYIDLKYNQKTQVQTIDILWIPVVLWILVFGLSSVLYTIIRLFV